MNPASNLGLINDFQTPHSPRDADGKLPTSDRRKGELARIYEKDILMHEGSAIFSPLNEIQGISESLSPTRERKIRYGDSLSWSPAKRIGISKRSFLPPIMRDPSTFRLDSEKNDKSLNLDSVNKT